MLFEMLQIDVTQPVGEGGDSGKEAEQGEFHQV